MRVLLTGSTGRLGGAFLSQWPAQDRRFEVTALNRAEADLSRPEELRATLTKLWRHRPFDALVNPAAMSGLEQCLDSPAEAARVNVDAPRVMAEFCQERGAHMVHFSTDYVFGGKTPGRPCEQDPTGPVNTYGRTKRDGELAVLNASENALVCRVSWLFGPAGGKSHFDHVLDRARAGEQQHLIGDKFSVPTFTGDVVEWTGVLLANKCSGVYHLCNAGEPESWFSYAQKVCRLAARHGHPSAPGRLIETSLHDAHFFRDRRPVHTAMLPRRLVSERLAEPRCWLEAAEVYLKSR